MININLIKKTLGFKKDAPAKWYGVTQTGKAETPYAVTRSATENTSTAPTEMDSAIELFCREAISCSMGKQFISDAMEPFILPFKVMVSKISMTIM